MTCLEDLKVGNRCVPGGSPVLVWSIFKGAKNPQTSAKSNLTPTAPVVTYDKIAITLIDPSKGF
jgi:hypothetical protein